MSGGIDPRIARGYIQGTEQRLRTLETKLSSIDKKVHKKALATLQKMEVKLSQIEHNVTKYGPDMSHQAHTVATRIRGLIAPHLPSPSAGGTGGPSGGADAGGATPPKGATSPVETLRKALSSASSPDEAKSNIQNWLFENLGITEEESGRLLGTLYGTFYETVNEDKEITAEMRAHLSDPRFGENKLAHPHFAPHLEKAIVSALLKGYEPLASGARIVIDGKPVSLKATACYFIAKKVGSERPSSITDSQIREHHDAFLKGLVWANSFPRAAAPLPPGARGAAGGSAGSPPTVAATRPRGVHNQSANCWAISAIQFFAHSEGMGIPFLQTLPQSASRDALIAAIDAYSKLGEGEVLDKSFPQNVRLAFRDDGLADIDVSPDRQHVASEAVSFLLTHNMPNYTEADCGWMRTRTFIHPSTGSSVTAAGIEYGAAHAVNGYVSKGTGETSLAHVMQRHGEPGGDTYAVRWKKNPPHFALDLSYQDITSGGRCPLTTEISSADGERHTFQLDSFIVHSGTARAGTVAVSGGHYYAIVRKSDGWYQVNDSSAKKISDSAVQTFLTPSATHRPTMVHYSRTS